jgi:hypothetical protein
LKSLEDRRLLAWSPHASLVNQDLASALYPKITGEGTTVAVIDTGINYKLPELGGGFGPGKKVVAGYDFFDADADPMDTTGHGTAVASVIAASAFTTGGVTYRGIAPNADLIALRVGTEDDISDANIEKSAAMGDRSSRRLRHRRREFVARQRGVRRRGNRSLQRRVPNARRPGHLRRGREWEQQRPAVGPDQPGRHRVARGRPERVRRRRGQQRRRHRRLVAAWGRT